MRIGQILPRFSRLFAIGLLLVSCGSPPPPIAAATYEAPHETASNGVVVAVRSVQIGRVTGGWTGVAAVLSTLQITAATADISTHEIVIRRPDGSIGSIIASDSDVAVGDTIAVEGTASPTLRATKR